MIDPRTLLEDLIARNSVTPDDAGCCERISELLSPLGFTIERLDRNGVTNLWARRGSDGPLVVLAGHTDVVPPGPTEDWDSDPFVPTERQGLLYGRGAADMKSGLAAMLVAAGRLIERRPELPGSIAFLITSDEEGPCRDGTRHVAAVLRERAEIPDYAIVGEAASLDRFGDRVMIGRRGSLGCNLRLLGLQGHVAYPERADNPIHRAAAVIRDLVAERWDDGNEGFPPTSFQVSNVHAGTGAHNVIPGSIELVFNFRYSTESTAEALKARVSAILERHEARCEADWWHTGEPFLTPSDSPLVKAAREAIAVETGSEPALSTAGGTSDGRFLAPLGTHVVEIGPVGRSIHRVNEHLRIDDLEPLTRVRERVIETLLTA